MLVRKTLIKVKQSFDFLGFVGAKKRITLPRERLYHSSVEEHYLKDLAFAAECKVDFVFTCYADDSDMLKIARANLPVDTKVFAKIETRKSVIST